MCLYFQEKKFLKSLHRNKFARHEPDRHNTYKSVPSGTDIDLLSDRGIYRSIDEPDPTSFAFGDNLRHGYVTEWGNSYPRLIFVPCNLINPLDVREGTY
jgi:hypothetical protein